MERLRSWLPRPLAHSDGAAVVKAVLAAKDDPMIRPIDPKKLRPLPKVFETSGGVATVPDDDVPDDDVVEASQADPTDVEPALDSETSVHTEIQWMLLKFGCDLGLDVWAARNDWGRSFKGKSFTDLPRIRKELPHQFDQATTRTIELIDVLWLRGNAIVAAFEIESTTVIYSGLLRMADLLAMQPNLNIPLYVVAPDARRDKVMIEVNRPTFSRLSPPLKDACRFISFSTLHDRLPVFAPFVQHLKPNVLEDLSESCMIE